MKNKTDNTYFNIIYILVIFLLIITWRSQIYWVTLGEITGNSDTLSRYTASGLLLLCIISFSLTKKYRIPKLSQTFKLYYAVIIGMYITSILWSIEVSLPSNAFYIKTILPIFVFYYFYKAAYKIGDSKLFVISLLLLLVTMLYTYFVHYQSMLFLLNVNVWSTNSSYFLLYILPVFFCFDKKWIKVGAFIAVGAAIILSSKRGGTLSLLFGLFAYLFVNQILRKGDGKIGRYIIFIIIITVSAYALSIIMLNDDIHIVSRMSKISETGGNGRDEIWIDVLQMLENSNIANILFGHGYNTVLAHSKHHLSAHNDFLEIFYDNGIIVLILYILFHVNLIKSFVKMAREGSKYAAPLALSYVAFLINSNVSHIFFYDYYLLVFAVTWGISYGLYQKEKVEKERTLYYPDGN